MNGKPRAPIDSAIGLPHLVIPYDTDAGLHDYHHLLWPRRQYESQDLTLRRMREALTAEEVSLPELGRVVVRMSLGQRLPRDIHDRVHELYDGPPPPETVDDMFEMAVKACSGVVSPWGVDLRRPLSSRLVRMDEQTFRQVTQRSVYHTERAFTGRSASYRRYLFAGFFMRYALEQDFEHIAGPTIREFVGTTDAARRRELGGIILKKALEAKLDPLISEHDKLRQRGYTQPGSPNLRTSIRKLIPKQELPLLFPMLTSRLLASI